jgi:HAD superfamily hydrolase (TIGR01458 family)
MAPAFEFEQPPALLLDIDGVLHVGDEPIPRAIETIAQLRDLSSGLRLLTNTTSRSRAEITARLVRAGFDVEDREILTPAAMATRHCAASDFKAVRMVVSDSLREDLEGIPEAPAGEPADAILLGDVGDAFDAVLLNELFALMQTGAELVALQHNRFWQHEDGLRLDVGAYAAALEYATQRKATVVGKPSPKFFESALADLGALPGDALMVGDDAEADVNGAQAIGIAGVLVRTGKYRQGVVAERGFGPAATIDSIADLPDLLKS